MRMPFIQLHQAAIVKARTVARMLKLPAYAGIGLAGELFAWALDMAPEDDQGNVDWSGDLGKGDPIAFVAAAVGFEGDADALFEAFVRVGFVEPANSHLRKNARVKGLDMYEATFRKAQKDRERKRVHRNSAGSREDGAGQTQTQTHKKLLEDPPAESGSGESSDARFDVEHWKDDIEELVTWMICERDLRGRFKPSTDNAVDKTRDWAVGWFLKYQPGPEAVVQIRAAFRSYIDSDFAQRSEADGRLELWCSETVWLSRWDEQRARRPSSTSASVSP